MSSWLPRASRWLSRLHRRHFLRTLGGASTAAVAAAASPIAATRGARPTIRARTRRKARYRETEHVKAFYRTNGYETLKK